MEKTWIGNPPKVRTVDRRLLVAAPIMGALAAGLIVAYLRSQASDGTASVIMRHVVVAAQEIQPGTKITASMVEIKSLPETAVSAGTVTSLDKAVGQTLRYPAARGEQISSLRLVEPPNAKALSFQIPQGARGFTIPVTVSHSPASLTVPGDFVDVLFTGPVANLGLMPPIGRNVVSVSGISGVVTLLQNIQVLAVQRAYVENGAPYDNTVRGEAPEKESVSYVTLALTPEQSELLWKAVSAKDGEITFALRAFGDSKISLGEAGTVR
ncbi:MAG: Flp pilus assembly protein CpaB [SAR202 cluster bacterium]|nr:Flp pilus assembly protein CpaB [SAR202 cluster bacterium]